MGERHLVDEAATRALGRELAGVTRAPLVVTLSGDLGAGKTSLARAWLHGLGHEGVVRSPTYTLIETYRLPAVTVHHMDLYRLADPEELEFIGVRDLAAEDALWLIEWPERGGDRLPSPDWALTLKFSGSGRIIAGLPAVVGVDTT